MIRTFLVLKLEEVRPRVGLASPGGREYRNGVRPVKDYRLARAEQVEPAKKPELLKKGTKKKLPSRIFRSCALDGTDETQPFYARN